MLITLNMLLDLVTSLKPEHQLDAVNGKTGFSGTYLLHSPADLVDPSLICVCDLSVAIPHAEKNPGSYYLCLRDRVQDGMETEDLISRMIVVGTNIGLPAFFNVVQAYFNKLELWNSRILEAMINKEGLQSLLDLSEGILENHVAVFDPTLRLLAHTKNIDPVEERARNMVRLGYHPEEDMQLFLRLRRFEAWVKSDDIIISDLPELGKLHRLVKCFRVSGAFVMIVTMCCAHRLITPGLIDLFSLFLEKMSIYLQRDYLPEETGDLKYSHFMTELIKNPNLTEGFVRSRAKNIGLSFETFFCLMKIAFEDPHNTPHIQVLSELGNYLSGGKPLLFEKEILILQMFSAPKLAEQKLLLETTMKRIAPLLIKYHAYCGISDICKTLMQVGAANRQASAALALGRRISSRRYLSSVLDIHKEYDTNFFHYPDYGVYDALKCLQDYPGPVSSLRASLDQLSAYDKKNHTDNMRFLYCYLIFERKSSVTGEHLHMHRNNVNYRVKRIEELINIDLDDPETRLRIQLLYRCLELG